MFTWIYGHIFLSVSTSIPTFIPTFIQDREDELQTHWCWTCWVSFPWHMVYSSKIWAQVFLYFNNDFLSFLICVLSQLLLSRAPIMHILKISIPVLSLTSLLVLNSLFHFNFDQVLSFLLLVLIMFPVGLFFLCCFQFDLHFYDFLLFFPVFCPLTISSGSLSVCSLRFCGLASWLWLLLCLCISCY